MFSLPQHPERSVDELVAQLLPWIHYCYSILPPLIIHVFILTPPPTPLSVPGTIASFPSHFQGDQITYSFGYVANVPFHGVLQVLRITLVQLPSFQVAIQPVRHSSTPHPTMISVSIYGVSSTSIPLHSFDIHLN